MITALSLLGFAWFVCCIQFSACLTWTKYPDAITRVWNGSTVALQWDYDLTSAEQNAAQVFISRIWNRGNESHLVGIASKDFNSGKIPPLEYDEYFKPHITISRSEEATLIINDVTKEDEGLYTFTVQLLTLNNFLISRNTTLEVRVQPTVKCKSSISVRKGEQAIFLCNVTGDPRPNITWTKVSEPGNIISYNSTLVIDNVCISDDGEYNITAHNGRSASVLVDLDVQYKPKNVSLTTNTTSNTCTGIVINFTCTAEANPPVHTYILYENDTRIKNMGISGTWLKTMKNAGQFVFRCEANNSIEGIVRSIDTILTVGVPASIEQAESKVAKEEGDNVEVYCNVTAGIPDPTIIWTKVNTEERIKGNPLIITNITRAQAGDYKCTANNTCGEACTMKNIDVQYRPDMVTLVTNTTENKDCSDLWVNFTCISSEANPPVYNYQLSSDKDGFSFNKSGTWIKKISKGGKNVYNCSAYQLVGNVTSTNSITLTVNVPLSMNQPKNMIVKEGENAEVYCNVTTGFPYPTVIWRKVDTGDKAQSGEPIEGNLLNITNITRAQAGDYRCTANNTCGEESTVVNIDVQYKPGDVHITTNTSRKVCTGAIINFTCTAEANPPVHTYLFYKNDTKIENMGKSWTLLKTMENAGQFVFRCEANNSFEGIGRSADTILNVEVPAAIVKQAGNKTVKEGENVEVYCNVTGVPDPTSRTVIWRKVDTGDEVVRSEPIEGNLLNITSITKAQAGDYRCTANNTCGEESTVANIDVQYPPTNTSDGRTIDVSVGSPASISCPVLGNPQPNITWYKENDNSTAISNSSTLEFSQTVLNDSGWYTCSATNHLGTVTVRVRLMVVVESTIFATATIDTNWDQRSDVQKRFPSMACELVKDKGCYSAQAEDIRPGSVIIDFSMKFNQSVIASEVLTVLKDAAKQDKFGDFKVDPESIKQTSPLPTDTGGTKKPICSGFFEKEDCSVKWQYAVIFAVVGLVIICVVIGVIVWWIHKRRKCRKDPRVHNSTSEEQPFSRQNGTPTDDNPYSQVNNGYADAGPRPTEMTNMVQNQGASAPAAVPDYAVVDRKGAKNDMKAAEQKPPVEAQYAEVDKSKKKKKKKKEEPDATYAQVDMSKKTKKKKPKPGEVLYADLGEFNQMREMPKVATSPEVLPPIKKPAPYVETQYADITQFLKGDATLPENKDSQETATGTKEEASAAKTGEGEETNNETFF